MSGAGGQRLTVRVYRGTPIAGRFLDKYQEILETASAHAAGAFMRECLLRGFAALESDGLVANGVRGCAAVGTPAALQQEKGDNTQQNNNELVSDNNSGDFLGNGHDAHTEVITALEGTAEDVGRGSAAGSGVRGMVSRLGLGAAQMGKADE